jgi:hypothetical protein
LWLEATADDFSVTPGDSLSIELQAINRSAFPLLLKKCTIPFHDDAGEIGVLLQNNRPVNYNFVIRAPESTPFSQPYWLREPHLNDYHRVDDQSLIGQPVGEGLTVTAHLAAGDVDLSFDLPVLFRWTDRVRGELYRTVEVRPAVSVDFSDKVYLFSPDNRTREISVTVSSNRAQSHGKVRLKAPPDWQITPAARNFSINTKYGEQILNFTLQAPEQNTTAELKVSAVSNDREFNRGIVRIDHDHIPTQCLFPVTTAKLVNIDLKTTGKNIAYIQGPGDDIPDCLTQIGYRVTLLDDDDLSGNSLSEYDAVITGIRSYNTREKLRHAQKNLLQYVFHGGTLIMQYNVSFGLITEELGPYPFRISRLRVTREHAPMRVLNPEHQLLQFPNKITPEDYQGWVQERGLYFADSWDDNYDTVFACHDPGEPDREGSLLFTRYGKGVFIYTGLSWFRQLPAGVPGAYRIFANMIASGQYKSRNHSKMSVE